MIFDRTANLEEARRLAARLVDALRPAIDARGAFKSTAAPGSDGWHSDYHAWNAAPHDARTIAAEILQSLGLDDGFACPLCGQ